MSSVPTFVRLLRVETATLGLLLLGVGLRGWHWLRSPSLWHDEAALVLNVLDKNFVELLGPLRFSEAAPPLFLWLEKLVSLTFGDGLLALRAPAAIAGIAALVLVWRIARRWLSPLGVVVAVVLIAANDRLLWHGCEAKQYAIEALIAISLVWLFDRTREWTSARRSLLFASLAPLVIWLAYPGCFLLGGYLLAEFFTVVRERRPQTWLAYGVAVAVTFVSFGLLALGPVAAQHDATIAACWQSMEKFPDFTRPATVPLWTLDAVASAFNYCFRPIGLVLLPLAIVGGWQLYQKQGAAIVTLLAAPPLVALGAAFLQAYPFGGSRVVIFAAPGWALLVAAGVETLAELARERRPWAVASVAALLAIMPVVALYRAVDPWSRADCHGAAAFVAAHRQEADRIATNHWEYEYYFRANRDSLVEWPSSTVDAERLWVVVTAASDHDRQALLASPPASHPKLTLRRQFERTTVVLFERDRPKIARR